jgi:hypothetical protein
MTDDHRVICDWCIAVPGGIVGRIGVDAWD